MNVKPTGLRYPFKLGANKGFGKADGKDKVMSNLRSLVKTTLNERLIKKATGTIGYSLLFRSGIDANATTVENLVFESIVAQEPRAVGVRVKAYASEEDSNSLGIIEISFIFKDTGDAGNLRVAV